MDLSECSTDGLLVTGQLGCQLRVPKSYLVVVSWGIHGFIPHTLRTLCCAAARRKRARALRSGPEAEQAGPHDEGSGGSCACALARALGRESLGELKDDILFGVSRKSQG